MYMQKDNSANEWNCELNELRAEATVRYLSSNNFIIPTKCIQDLEKKLMMWSKIGATGACIWGRPRLGKSFSIQYIASKFKEKYGENFPVVIWNVTDHPPKERSFYASILLEMGLSAPKSMTAIYLKEKLINHIKVMAYETKLRRVIFLIDEAWQLQLCDFSWLMDLYNNLALENVHFTCFLFGTKQLKDLKGQLQCAGMDQIVERFMIKEEVFFGLTNAQEMAFCLYELDRTNARDENNIELNESLIKFFFPYADNHTFTELANDYWNAFKIIRQQYGVKPQDIPMKYFMDSFNILLLTYGKNGSSPVSFPTKTELIECVKESGYGYSGANNG